MLRILAGASVAVPYAVVCWAVGVAGRATVAAPASLGALVQGSFRVHPGVVPSVLLPLGFGLVAGASGAVVDEARQRAVGVVRRGVVGGWAAFALGLALAFVG